MKTRKTKAEILDDVVKHIKKQGGRALNVNGSCVYITDDGKTCGHSMALKPSKRKGCDSLGAAYYVINELGDTVHQVKYQGHNVYFWRNVQDFHDSRLYWDNQGNITDEGLVELNKLKKKWS